MAVYSSLLMLLWSPHGTTLRGHRYHDSVPHLGADRLPRCPFHSDRPQATFMMQQHQPELPGNLSPALLWHRGRLSSTSIDPRLLLCNFTAVLIF